MQSEHQKPGPHSAPLSRYPRQYVPITELQARVVQPFAEFISNDDGDDDDTTYSMHTTPCTEDDIRRIVFLRDYLKKGSEFARH